MGFEQLPFSCLIPGLVDFARPQRGLDPISALKSLSLQNFGKVIILKVV